MSDKYEAKMDNNYHSFDKNYWEVVVKANSLNNLSNVCSAINLLRKGTNVVDQGVQLDFLMAENKHMKSVLDENKHLQGTIDNLSEDYQSLMDKNKEIKEILAFRSNQLALMEKLVNDLGSEEMARQMEEILKGDVE